MRARACAGRWWPRRHRRPPAAAAHPAVPIAPRCRATGTRSPSARSSRRRPRPRVPPPVSMSSLAFVQLAVYNAVVAIEGGYEPYGRPLRPGPARRWTRPSRPPPTTCSCTTSRRGATDARRRPRASLAGDPGRAREGAAGRPSATTPPRRCSRSARATAGWPTSASRCRRPDRACGSCRPASRRSCRGCRRVRPFALRSPDQFRPGPPPALTSRRYARDFDELERMGGAVSARTPEQTPDRPLLHHPPGAAVRDRVPRPRRPARPGRAPDAHA